MNRSLEVLCKIPGQVKEITIKKYLPQCLRGDEKLAPQRQNEKYQSMKGTFFLCNSLVGKKIQLTFMMALLHTIHGTTYQ